MDPKIKMLLGFKPDTPDRIVKQDWERRTKGVCKPCLEIKYCPYGPLVEQFPAIPMTLDEALEDYEETERCLESGRFNDGKPLDKATRAVFEDWVKTFDANEYPEELSKDQVEMGCRVYGHICPVAFAAEPFTETKDRRRTGRAYPKKTLLRIARRDNCTCQICGTHLKDEEIELDHVIPISKGGSSEESNLQVACMTCNRRKSNRVEE